MKTMSNDNDRKNKLRRFLDQRIYLTNHRDHDLDNVIEK